MLAISLILDAAALYTGDHVLSASAALLTVIFAPLAFLLDRYRRSVKVDYDLTGPATAIAGALLRSFDDLMNCARVWHISAQGRTADWKRNAGASSLVSRKPVQPTVKRPSCVRGKGQFPCITLGTEDLYLLPDAMLLVAKHSVTALTYQEISVVATASRFIESEAVPRDAAVIDQTWAYVNKNGGPDRRFSGNRQLPVCMYGEMTFTSPHGLNGLIQYSNASGGDRFVRVIEVLQGLDAAVPQAKTIKSFRPPLQVFSVLFWLAFLPGALALGLACSITISERTNSRRSGMPPSAAAPLPPPPKPATSKSNQESSKTKQPKRDALPPPLDITPRLPPR